MATIKSYTDLNQSKKLAEILPLESADMWHHGHYSPLKSERKYDDEPCPFHSVSPNWDKPCWSLSALLSVIRKTVGYEVLCLDRKNIIIKCELSDEPWSIEINKNNEVDACYEMILKLHELNLL